MASLRPGELVDAGRQDEIQLGQAIDGVGEDLHLDSPPAEGQIGMVPQLLGQLADSLDMSEGQQEVGETEFPDQMVISPDAPILQLCEPLLSLGIGGQRRLAVARRAVPLGERFWMRHGVPSRLDVCSP